ncbi:PREDICTED: mucin-4-like [Tinamus guttatus]|nr:PREDICTED: mucin-4-like [Tinamus guttatus]
MQLLMNPEFDLTLHPCLPRTSSLNAAVAIPVPTEGPLATGTVFPSAVESQAPRALVPGTAEMSTVVPLPPATTADVPASLTDGLLGGGPTSPAFATGAELSDMATAATAASEYSPRSMAGSDAEASPSPSEPEETQVPAGDLQALTNATSSVNVSQENDAAAADAASFSTHEPLFSRGAEPNIMGATPSTSLGTTLASPQFVDVKCLLFPGHGSAPSASLSGPASSSVVAAASSASEIDAGTSSNPALDASSSVSLGPDGPKLPGASTLPGADDGAETAASPNLGAETLSLGGSEPQGTLAPGASTLPGPENGAETAASPNLGAETLSFGGSEPQGTRLMEQDPSQKELLALMVFLRRLFIIWDSQRDYGGDRPSRRQWRSRWFEHSCFWPRGFSPVATVPASQASLRKVIPKPGVNGAAALLPQGSSNVVPAPLGGPVAPAVPLPVTAAVPLYSYGTRENDREYVERRVDFNSPLFKPETGFPFGKALRDSLYFTDNGQIIFPASDKNLFPFSSPPPGGFNGREKVPMIAVFWDDADFSRGVGTTFYQEFFTLNSAKPPFVLDVEAKIRRYMKTSYSAVWTLKITWEKAPAHTARTDTRRTSTYQAVLTTDGFRSYLLILYQDGGMRWDYGQLAATNVLIGYSR